MPAAELKAGDSVAYTHPAGQVLGAKVTCVWRDNFSGARRVNIRLEDGSEVRGLTHFPAPYLGHLHTPELPKPPVQVATTLAPKKKGKSDGQ